MGVRATERLIGDAVIVTALPKSPQMAVKAIDEGTKIITTSWFSDDNSYQERTKLFKHYSENLDKILQLYAINKSQFDRKEITPIIIISKIQKKKSKRNIVQERTASKEYKIKNLVYGNIKKTKNIGVTCGY